MKIYFSLRIGFFLVAPLLAVFLSHSLHAAQQVVDGDTVGSLSTYTANNDDNLYELGRRFDVGLVALLAANHGVDVWQPESARLVVPGAHILPEGPRRGLVINLSELRLYYFADEDHVYTYPIGIGREGWQTPVGEMSIVRKKKAPDWIPPPSIRRDEPQLPAIVPAGPDNPMGAYALYLGKGSYAIHGTNKPYGIGKRSSHGCIRMYPEDIEELFTLVKTGTRVRIIDKPYSIGWRGDSLYLKVNPTQKQADVISEEYSKPAPVSIPGVHQAVRTFVPEEKIDWHTVDRAIAEQSGVPVRIGRR